RREGPTGDPRVPGGGEDADVRRNEWIGNDQRWNEDMPGKLAMRSVIGRLVARTRRASNQGHRATRSDRNSFVRHGRKLPSRFRSKTVAVPTQRAFAVRDRKLASSVT